VSLYAETAGPVLTVPGAPPAFHVMARPTGAVCNLDCEYCFFLSKEMLGRCTDLAGCLRRFSRRHKPPETASGHCHTSGR